VRFAMFIRRRTVMQWLRKTLDLRAALRGLKRSQVKLPPVRHSVSVLSGELTYIFSVQLHVCVYMNYIYRYSFICVLIIRPIVIWL